MELATKLARLGTAWFCETATQPRRVLGNPFYFGKYNQELQPGDIVIVNFVWKETREPRKQMAFLVAQSEPGPPPFQSKGGKVVLQKLTKRMLTHGK